MFEFQKIITLNADRRGGSPCIRNLRITVYDILKMLASGMTSQEILEDFPELKPQDVLASLSFASAREQQNFFTSKNAITA